MTYEQQVMALKEQYKDNYSYQCIIDEASKYSENIEQVFAYLRTMINIEPVIDKYYRAMKEK